MKKQLRKKSIRKKPARKEPSIASILGLKQIEVAMLLGIHRSQWSMFESGKRSLPAAATEILATLLSAAQTEDASAKGTADDDAYHSERQQLLNKLLLENTYQRETISRTITDARIAHETNIRRQRVADCLNAQSHPMGKTINDKAEKALKFNGRLLELELKQEVLELERNLIESKLGRGV